MAKPTADSDAQLIRQIGLLKGEIETRVEELKARKYEVVIGTDGHSGFSINVKKTVLSEAHL